MSELRRIRMYRATSRPLLLMGGERELMIMLIVLRTAIIFAGISWVTTGVGLTIWGLGTFLLRKMANTDPQMTKVFLRYWNYFRQDYYLAASRPTSAGFYAVRKN